MEKLVRYYNSINQHTQRTIIYYAIAVPLFIFVEYSGAFKSGPCTPNFDVLFFVLALTVTPILFIISIVRLIRKGKLYLYSFIIHLFAMLALPIMLIV
jgi:hypothetical protein